MRNQLKPIHRIGTAHRTDEVHTMLDDAASSCTARAHQNCCRNREGIYKDGTCTSLFARTKKKKRGEEKNNTKDVTHTHFHTHQVCCKQHYPWPGTLDCCTYTRTATAGHLTIALNAKQAHFFNLPKLVLSIPCPPAVSRSTVSCSYPTEADVGGWVQHVHMSEGNTMQRAGTHVYAGTTRTVRGHLPSLLRCDQHLCTLERGPSHSH